MLGGMLGGMLGPVTRNDMGIKIKDKNYLTLLRFKLAFICSVTSYFHPAFF